MSVWEVLGGIAIIIMSLIIIAAVLLQESTKGSGLSALSGGDSDSFFSKNPGRTREAMLYKATKYCAILFFVVTIAVYAIIYMVNR